jgi:M6 family metalloprotease-like protein
MILANFNNTTTTYTQTNFSNYMNQVNYNGTGSFKDFYLEVSNGLLTVNTTVTIWVILPNPHDYYGPESKWGQFAYDAVVAADAQAGVNFADYDNNGDGVVDGVAIIHQGRGQEESGNTNDIWSHSWELSSAGYSPAQRTFDGVLVDAYTAMPEKNGSSMGTIGVMCHEFGHNLGSPDFYDTDYGTGGQYNGTGNWDVMAGGSWNGASGTKPAHHNAWTKNYFTWTNPAVLTTMQTVVLRNAQIYTDVVRYNTATPNEYFLCENRQKTGFDVGIPGHGMIIYHVDGNFISAHLNSNDINNTSHQGMYPMSATSTTANGISTSSGSTINTGGCPWPGTSNKTTFTDGTTPCSKSWAGTNTAKPLVSIAENTATKEVSFCFLSCPSPLDPSALTANAASSSQINLGWTKNSNNDPVVIAYSLTGAFGTPVNGTPYSAGNTIAGGGTVLYNGPNTTYNHASLTPNTTYYYKAWSVLTGTTYSPGITASATTLCNAVAALPYSESFAGTTIPSCWSQVDYQGNNQIWKFGVITTQVPNPNLTGNYAFLCSNDYGSGNTQNADLVSPAFVLSGYTNITLQFSHYFLYRSGSSATVSYSTDDGFTWTMLQTFTATSATNPVTFSQMIPALAGQSQVKFKWNYTGTYGYYWAIDNVNITGTSSGPSLAVTPANQEVPATPAGSVTFTVTSNSPWTASSDQPWCTVTPTGTGDGTITANYVINTSLSSRVANITTIVSGIPSVSVTVTQAGATPLLTVTPANLDVPATPAGSTAFTVISNVSWAVLSDQAWCTPTPSGFGNGTIVANYAENTTTSSRIAILTVNASGLPPQTTTLTQSGALPALEINPPSQHVTQPAGSTNFTVTSNSTWTAISNVPWCTVPASGTGSGTLVATYQGNPSNVIRTASITVTVAGITPGTVTVVQDGTVGIADPQHTSIVIVPNPATGLFRIVPGIPGKIRQIDILDLTGRILVSRNCMNDSDYLFDLSNESQGCYFVKVILNDEILVRRLVISK